MKGLVAGGLRLGEGGEAGRKCRAVTRRSLRYWGIDMQQPSRRQFVAASLAGLPMLAHASTTAPFGPPQAASAAKPAIRTGDPVLDQTLTNLRDLVAEGDADPGVRKGAARAIEATLGVHAAHVAANYDARVKRALKLCEARFGRAGFIEEVVRHARQAGRHDVTHDKVDTALTLLEQHGAAGLVRDLQRAMRAARLRAPDALQAVAWRPAQFDFCADVGWIIELAEFAAGITCFIAFAEPTLALEPFCVAATLYVTLLKGLRAWFC